MCLTRIFSTHKLVYETFFCFPLTGNNSLTLTFLFDCLDMKRNIPTCF